MLRKEKTPGPGAYNVTVRPVTPTSPAYTIASKAHGGQANLENPGPGAYYPDTGRSSPSYSIHAKISTVDREKISVPGPGTYNTEHLVTRPSEPSYTMSSRKIDFPRAISPGPGQYTLPRGMTGPSYTISGKRQFYGQPDNPGPGAYSPDNRPNSPCYTMGYRTGKGAQSQTPGPGAYRPNDGEKGPSYTMAIRKSERVENSPGPGQYQVEPGFAQALHRQPAYTMHGRGGSGMKNLNPGPGHYNAEKRASSPSYTIGGRRQEGGGKPTPGPGSYENHRPGSSPAYTMGYRPSRAPRFVGPGPGSYSPRTSGGPAFSILHRKAGGPKNLTPGPGEYNQVKVTERSSPAYSIGRKLEREQDRRNQGPGPGQYRVRRQEGGPKYSMHSGTQRFNYY